MYLIYYIECLCIVPIAIVLMYLMSLSLLLYLLINNIRCLRLLNDGIKIRRKLRHTVLFVIFKDMFFLYVIFRNFRIMYDLLVLFYINFLYNRIFLIYLKQEIGKCSRILNTFLFINSSGVRRRLQCYIRQSTNSLART